MTDQLFCTVHRFGPVGITSSQVRTEHETTTSDNCNWQTYNPTKHLNDYKNSEIDGDDHQEKISLKIYNFAKQKIKKTIVSDVDSSKVIAVIKTNNHSEFLDLSTSKAKQWLQYFYFIETKENYGAEAYASALSLLMAEAVHTDAARVTIYNRIAKVKDVIYYDLVSLGWDVIKVDKEGVTKIQLDENSPIFERTQSQSCQIEPKFERKSALNDLVKLLRIQSKDTQLFKVQLIGFFVESISVPIMTIIGEHGSIKSTISKAVKQIVDPSGAATVSLAGGSENLILSLNNRYVTCFDNISKIDQPTSDILCKAITGDGNSKRKLFTDSDEIIYSYKRKIILNGIAPTMEFPDLLDRNITYSTQRVPEDERITEEEFNKRFEELLPNVLGCIFDALSNSLSIYETVAAELKHVPRMASFTKFGEAIARSLGYAPFSFSDNYKERIKSHSLEILEEYPIIYIIQDILTKSNGHYEDTVGNFFQKIKSHAENDDIDIKSKEVHFPKIPNQVKQHIQKLKPDLRALGVEIDIAPYTKRDGRHPKNRSVIYIDEIKNTINGYDESQSQPSRPSLPNEIQAQNGAISGRGACKDILLNQTLSLPYIAKFMPTNQSGNDGNDGRDDLKGFGDTTK